MIEHTPKVSVIVPNYNHAGYIVKRLDSILCQSHRDFELIVLDDCSTDGSAEIITKYIAEHQDEGISISYVKNEENSGSPFIQWGKGIRLAKGEYIWIAESDDYADREFLKTLMTKASRYGLDLCFCQSKTVDADGNTIGLLSSNIWYKEDHFFCYPDISKAIGAHNIVPNASAVIFRKALSLPYLEVIKKYRMSGDWLLWAAIIKSGKLCGYVSSPLNHYRIHPDSTSSSASKQYRHISEAFMINRDFDRQGIWFDTEYWIGYWLRKTGYNLHALISNNFMDIFSKLHKVGAIATLLFIKELILRRQKDTHKWTNLYL